MEDGSTIRWVVWIGGCCLWIFGLCDRSIAAWTDHLISALDIVLLGTAAIVALGWVLLIPTSSGKILNLYEKLAYRLGIFR
jgi:hypothetical protein